LTSILGACGAGSTLYLLKPPILDGLPEGQIPAVEDIVRLNGNNWRKILTIFAKLVAPGDDWKSYRDQQLLQQYENISFTPQLLNHDGWHLIGGKACWQAMGYHSDDFTPLEPQGRILTGGRLVLMPYPDYRQFPNELIGQLRQHLSNPLI